MCPLLDIFNKHKWLHFCFGKKSRHSKATMYDLTVTFQSNFMMSGCSFSFLHIFFLLPRFQPWVYSYSLACLWHMLSSLPQMLSPLSTTFLFFASSAFSLLIKSYLKYLVFSWVLPKSFKQVNCLHLLCPSRFFALIFVYRRLLAVQNCELFKDKGYHLLHLCSSIAWHFCLALRTSLNEWFY